MADRNAVREFICANFYVPESMALSDGDSLLEAGIIDSTGVLDVIAFLESSFGVTLADDEIVPENLDSIDRIVAFVGRKRSPPVVAS